MKLDKELIKGTATDFKRELKEYRKKRLREYKEFLTKHTQIHPDVIESFTKGESEEFDSNMEIIFGLPNDFD